MRKFSVIAFVTLSIIIVLSFSSCGIIGTACVSCVAYDLLKPEDKILLDLPEYESKEMFSLTGIDLTAFNRFYYDINAVVLEDSDYLEKIQEDDLLEINSFVKHFENCIDGGVNEVTENYDFDKVEIEVGDYFYIESNDRYKMKATFDSYDFYYFDVETQILYFMHHDY